MRKFLVFKLLFLLFFVCSYAQDSLDQRLLGKWKITNVSLTKAEGNSSSENSNFLIKAFTNAGFNFKGNRIFRIKFGKASKSKLKQQFFQGDQNWIVNGDNVFIGTKENSFATMKIQVESSDERIRFILRGVYLEAKKLSSDKPSLPLIIKTKRKRKVPPTDYSKSKMISVPIDSSAIVPFKMVTSPPMLKEFRLDWTNEDRKKSFINYIRYHITRKFNTNLAAELRLTGLTKLQIEFIVDKQGKVVNTNVTGGHPKLIEHSKLVVGLLPDFEPATLEGIPVNVRHSLPLVFQIVD